MIELYPQIRTAHIALISLSGTIMALRFLLAMLGQRWADNIAIKLVAWFIDASIITAATMLLTIIPREVYANGWLAVKLVFVALYFGFGHFGLGSNRSARLRLICAAVSLSAFGLAYAIARAHDPLLGLG